MVSQILIEDDVQQEARSMVKIGLFQFVFCRKSFRLDSLVRLWMNPCYDSV